MQIEYINNPVYVNEDSTIIDCTVKFSHLKQPVMFAASASDPEPHGQEIYQRIVAGEFGSIAPFVPRVITQEEKMAGKRAMRDEKLREMDAIVANPLRWASFSPDLQAAWTTYRQALLDVPQQAGFPDNIVWPTPPQ